MGRAKNYRFFVADFETTFFEGQEFTEVWAAACVEMYSERVEIFHSIEETLNYLIELKSNVICFFHNLKFDGSFWVDYFLNKTDYKQASIQTGDEEYQVKWIDDNKMKNGTFKYCISDRGQWYSITVKVKGHFIEFRDSLKLLPFSVKEIGKAFKTKHKKLEMEYKGFRYAGCEITDEEKKYIENDVLVVKEALETMFLEGHTKITIGSCCLSEYKSMVGEKYFDAMYPNMYEIGLDEQKYGVKSVGEYIRRSYKGGWCYLVKGKENRIFTQGVTADVNSLYPSMMSSESGNFYPIGTPKFWSGDYIPDEAKADHTYYFIRIKTRFYLKPGKLPFIQIKNSWMYKATEALETSDVYSKSEKKYSAFYCTSDGLTHDTRVTLTLTMTDYVLFLEHYNTIDFEILDGCYFPAIKGIFDEYIDKYRKLKLESTGAKRTLAKLFLNNLYGKMASSTDSSFKYAYVKDDLTVGFMPVPEYDKIPGYIPIGSAITSYARNFTIRAAQKNFYGANKPGFIYADTDSIHCDLPASEIKGITVHDKNFCCWKLESSWDYAFFVRQKTYIEHVMAEDLKPIGRPYNNIKCAGMPDKCKNLFELSMQPFAAVEDGRYTEDAIKFLSGKGQSEESLRKTVLKPEEIEFLSQHREITDFKIGLCVPGKLIPKRIRGGILLTETTYEMR